MASTSITPAFLAAIANVKISSSADVNTYFQSKTGKSFIDWFNASVAQKEYWGKQPPHHSPVTMAHDADAQNRFNALWNQTPVLFGSSSVNLLQFVALMSIVNNETGGKLMPTTERVGNVGNPGLAYAFNVIPGTKKSYNTLSTNKTAYDLFHDADFKARHGNLALGDSLKDTTNVAWKGTTYPAGIDSSTDPARTGFIQETDFYKFRGRGFIQTTGRTNYKPIIDYILQYTGSNVLVNQYKSNWKGKSSETIATISTNRDWDVLFQNTDLLIPAVAINVHNKACGGYLAKITLQPGADNSIKNMGKAISGTDSYATLFYNRVLQVLNGLGN